MNLSFSRAFIWTKAAVARADTGVTPPARDQRMTVGHMTSIGLLGHPFPEPPNGDGQQRDANARDQRRLNGLEGPEPVRWLVLNELSQVAGLKA
jgi:hypothetical protein